MGGIELNNFISLENALESLLGSSVKAIATERVFGGDINEAYHLTLSDRSGEIRHVFMKTNAKENESFFAAEAAGLDAIMQTGAINVPGVLGSGIYGERSFLLMEYIKGTAHIPDYWEVFARQLAAMHNAATVNFVSEGSYGFVQDNYIGARCQMNLAYDKWTDFFRDCRLRPQFESASGYFDKSDCKKINRLVEHVGDILIEPEHPSLLHGDLWSGNVIAGNDGKAWLIDPAVYVGHAEADLAMTELFGGFPSKFYAAYKEVAPFKPGYEQRRDLYNLYHLLNHLNMFGRTYLSSVKRVIDEYVFV